MRVLGLELGSGTDSIGDDQVATFHQKSYLTEAAIDWQSLRTTRAYPQNFFCLCSETIPLRFLLDDWLRRLSEGEFLEP